MGGGAEGPQARMQKRNNNGSWSTSSVSMGGVARLCYCGSNAAIRTSKTEKNPGRNTPKIVDFFAGLMKELRNLQTMKITLMPGGKVSLY
ncbi:hypothetical protein SESBI_14758 [Sesbania bispinosa]|nr:hypothetical protein SESBI_14758 [Sesbania bispinosa]